MFCLSDFDQHDYSGVLDALYTPGEYIFAPLFFADKSVILIKKRGEYAKKSVFFDDAGELIPHLNREGEGATTS